MTTKVQIRVDDDEQASKVRALLEALGYEIERIIGDTLSHEALTWAVNETSRTAGLTERERAVLCAVLREESDDAAATLDVAEKTVKWHLHNILGKVGASSRIELARKVLGLVRIGLPRTIVMGDDNAGAIVLRSARVSLLVEAAPSHERAVHVIEATTLGGWSVLALRMLVTDEVLQAQGYSSAFVPDVLTWDEDATLRTGRPCYTVLFTSD